MDFQREFATEVAKRITDFKLKLKQLPTLKVSDMEKEIPQKALTVEKEVLKKNYQEAFLHQKLQETAIFYSKFFEEAYNVIKKGSAPKQLSLPDYKELPQWEEIEKFDDDKMRSEYLKAISEIIKDAKNLIERYNDEDERTKASENMASKFKRTHAEFNIMALNQRKIKRRIKEKNKQYLKQVNKGIRFDKTIGALEPDPENNPKQYKYYGKWMGKVSSTTITPDRVKAIMKTVTDN